MIGGLFVWRVKRKSVLRKGRLPELRVWVVEGAHYLICVFYGGTLRIDTTWTSWAKCSVQESSRDREGKNGGKDLEKAKRVFRLQLSKDTYGR